MSPERNAAINRANRYTSISPIISKTENSAILFSLLFSEPLDEKNTVIIPTKRILTPMGRRKYHSHPSFSRLWATNMIQLIAIKKPENSVNGFLDFHFGAIK